MAQLKKGLDFYDVDRGEFLARKPLHLRLSSASMAYDLPRDRYLVEASKFIKRNFHGVFGYVTGEKIPSFDLNTGTSNSSCSLAKNHIDIGLELLRNDAFTQQEKVDAVFGVALHEMYHKRYTITGLAEHFEVDRDHYYDFIKGNMPRLDRITDNSVRMSILNILEDYRIEKLGMRDMPGYVFYFDASREYALELHSDKAVSSINLEPTLMEWLMYRVLLPELCENFLIDIKIGVQEAVGHSLADGIAGTLRSELIVPTIEKIEDYLCTSPLPFSDDFEDILKATSDIYDMIPDAIKNALLGYKKSFSSTHVEFWLPVDGKSQFTSISTDEYVEIMEALAKDDAVKAEGQFRIEDLHTFDCADGRYDKVRIYKPTRVATVPEVISQARRMSTSIARNLGYLASKLNMSNDTYELTEGELDEDEMHKVGRSDTIFYEEEPHTGFEMDFAILIDESGSMDSGKKKEQAILTALSIVMGVMSSPHVNAFVYGHSCGRNTNDGLPMGQFVTELYEYYNPKRGVTRWENILSVSADGGNADGYAIAKVGDIMFKDSQARKKIMIVISDGRPAAPDYGGEQSHRHVRRVVDDLERRGIVVIQVAIESIKDSAVMFKHFIPFDPKGNFSKKIQDVLNKELVRFSSHL